MSAEQITSDYTLYCAIAELLGVPSDKVKIDLDILEQLVDLSPEVRQALAGWVERSRAHLASYAATAQLATAWSVSESFVRERVRAGQLEAKARRRRLIYSPEAIEEFIRQRVRPATS
jgi:hypothetical protein